MTIFDFSKYGYISASQDGEIYIGGATAQGFLIGKYETVERAKEVVAEIFALLDACGRYDMPII